MRIIIPFFLFLLFSISIQNAAEAQLWLEDRQEAEGPGIKLGKTLVLHVGLGSEVGVDSNVTYDYEPLPAGLFRITPYLDISTRSKQRMASFDNSVQQVSPKALFRFGVAAFYSRYLGGDSELLDKFNSKTNPFGVNSHLNFTVYPERKVSLFGGFTYLKTLEPYESSSDAQNKHNLVPTLGLRIMPGGGTLTIEPKYRLNLLVFDDPGIRTDSNRFSHEASLSTNWRVFPKTALISTVIFRPTVYFGNYAGNVDSYPLRSWVGAQGLLFEKFGFRALLGYGAGFYESGPDFEGVIGDLALMFHMSEVSHFTIGIKRDFVDSFYANYYVMNGGYTSLERMFGGRFLLTAKGSIYKRYYATFPGEKFVRDEPNNLDYDTTTNTTDREDVWINFNLLAELRASDWLAFHLSLKFWKDVTDFVSDTHITSIDPDEAEVPVDEHLVQEAAFSKAEILIGARAHF